MFEVTVLAVLQGVAEFLPVSSSGHLVLGKSLLGLGDTGMRLDVFLHLGTLLAVVCFYFRVIGRIISGITGGGASRRESWAYVGKIALSAVPVCAMALLMHNTLGAAFSSTKAVGAALAFTGAVLIATRFLPRGNGSVSFFKAVLMGLAQAVAVFPGVSRSGMTLAAAKAAGVDSAKAAEFSFLMSVPPIAGAALLEVMEGLRSVSPAAEEVPWGLTLYGAALAAAVGWVSLAVLLKMLRGNSFWMFGVYCLAVSAAVLAFS